VHLASLRRQQLNNRSGGIGKASLRLKTTIVWCKSTPAILPVMAHTSPPIALAFMAGVLYYVCIGG